VFGHKRVTARTIEYRTFRHTSRCETELFVARVSARLEIDSKFKIVTRPRRSCPQQIRARLVGRTREATVGSVVGARKRCGDGQTQTAGTPNLVVGDSVGDMPDKRKYLVRTWSVPGERESVEVTYRQAMDMAKKVKRNADCTGEKNPSFKRMQREVEAVDHWIQAMQSPDWLSSGYVVGPITSSNPGRGDGEH
jgi:hypothetical protein